MPDTPVTLIVRPDRTRSLSARGNARSSRARRVTVNDLTSGQDDVDPDQPVIRTGALAPVDRDQMRERIIRGRPEDARARDVQSGRRQDVIGTHVADFRAPFGGV